MRPSGRRARRGQSAVSMVEFAIVAPLFLILIFLILDFGKVIYVKNTLDSAARDGARAAVVLTSTLCGGGEPTACDVEKTVKNHSSDVSLANPSPYCPAVAPTAGNSGLIFLGPAGTAPGGEPAASGVCPGGGVFNVTAASNHAQITVTIEYCYKPLMPLLSAVLALATSGNCQGGITLVSTSTMKTEY